MQLKIAKAAVREKINNIFVEQFEIEKEDLSPEKRLFDDFGLDSLDIIDLVVRFQKEFNEKPSNEELMKIKTLGDVYSLAEKYFDK